MFVATQQSGVEVEVEVEATSDVTSLASLPSELGDLLEGTAPPHAVSMTARPLSKKTRSVLMMNNRTRPLRIVNLAGTAF